MNSEFLSSKDTYTVKAKPYKGMGFAAFLFLPLFLANPDIGVIDFIPDFIGYIILLFSLSKLRDISERFENAYKKILISAFISAGKLVALFLSFGVLGRGEGGAGSSQMLFSLVFTALEYIYVIPAICEFFSAISQAGASHGCEYAYAERRKLLRGKGKNGERLVLLKTDRTTHVKRVTVVFLAVRSLCATLPQLSVGSSHGYDDGSFDFSRFTGLFNVIGFMVCSVFSLIWLVSVYRYLVGLVRQKEFKEALKETYRKKVSSNKAAFILRDIGRLSLFLTVSAFLLPDLFINANARNVIPDFLFGAVLFLVTLSLGELMKGEKKLRMASLAVFGAYILSNIVRELMRSKYFSSYTLYSYYKNPTAYAEYNTFSFVYVVDALLLTASVAMLSLIISRIESGYALSRIARENEATLRMTVVESEEFRRSYVRPLPVMAAVASLASIAYPFVIKLSTSTFGGVDDATMKLVSFIVGLTATYWVFDFAMSFVLAVLITRALSALKDRVEMKLMLD